MITKATVLVDGEPCVDITSQVLLGIDDTEPGGHDEDTIDTGEKLYEVTHILEEAFRQIFSDHDVEVVLEEE